MQTVIFLLNGVTLMLLCATLVYLLNKLEKYDNLVEKVEKRLYEYDKQSIAFGRLIYEWMKLTDDVRVAYSLTFPADMREQFNITNSEPLLNKAAADTIRDMCYESNDEA